MSSSSCNMIEMLQQHQEEGAPAKAEIISENNNGAEEGIIAIDMDQAQANNAEPEQQNNSSSLYDMFSTASCCVGIAIWVCAPPVAWALGIVFHIQPLASIGAITTVVVESVAIACACRAFRNR